MVAPASHGCYPVQCTSSSLTTGGVQTHFADYKLATGRFACSGEPECKKLLLAIGPQRMAIMLQKLGLQAAVQCVSKMGPQNTAAVTIMELGPHNGAELFKNLGSQFSAGKVVTDNGACDSQRLSSSLKVDCTVSLFGTTAQEACEKVSA